MSSNINYHKRIAITQSGDYTQEDWSVYGNKFTNAILKTKDKFTDENIIDNEPCYYLKYRYDALQDDKAKRLIKSIIAQAVIDLQSNFSRMEDIQWQQQAEKFLSKYNIYFRNFCILVDLDYNRFCLDNLNTPQQKLNSSNFYLEKIYE